MSFIWVLCRNMGDGSLTGTEVVSRQLHLQNPSQVWLATNETWKPCSHYKTFRELLGLKNVLSM